MAEFRKNLLNAMAQVFPLLNLPIRLRFGYGFKSCDANGPQNVKNANPAKHTHLCFQAPPSYGSGSYGLGVFGAPVSVLRDRCSVGTCDAFFSITFLSIQAVSWGGQSSVKTSGFPGPQDPNHPQRKPPFGTGPGASPISPFLLF